MEDLDKKIEEAKKMRLAAAERVRQARGFLETQEQAELICIGRLAALTDWKKHCETFAMNPESENDA